MAGQDRVLSAARLVLRGFLYVNIAAAVMFAIAILVSFPLDGALTTQLTRKYGPAMDVGAIIWGLRLLALAGIVSGVTLHQIFAALLAIVATVRAGDPFTAANARRLHTIAWAMLVIQLLDLGLGGFTAWAMARHLEMPSWTPTFSGWIVVLMLFVLARVFQRGAEMRDDLAMTV
ncbi:DUF2975 domain-containing protein [Sphingomonas sp. PAMC 26621]|uniref:DUF2975 domain-containing protein n=1 Tax=Sphingomonas sp. PAMC 26621 TaxID=1112213 RepID=UPI000288D6EE|nr:DUF2975 domain-containing protein [Sphingomonas sp. PAMC 26621]